MTHDATLDKDEWEFFLTGGSRVFTPSRHEYTAFVVPTRVCFIGNGVLSEHVQGSQISHAHQFSTQFLCYTCVLGEFSVLCNQS